MQVPLGVDVRENFHKEMPIHSSCLASEKINEALPEGTTIAPSTTRRYLREQGLFGRVAVKKPFLKQQNRKRRLSFAKEHKIGLRMTGTRYYGRMNRSLNFLARIEGFMCDDAQVSGSLTTAFPLQSNMGVDILWFGVQFREEEWAIW